MQKQPQAQLMSLERSAEFEHLTKMPTRLEEIKRSFREQLYILLNEAA